MLSAANKPIKLSDSMLNLVMLSVVMLSVVKLSAIMLNVVTLHNCPLHVGRYPQTLDLAILVDMDKRSSLLLKSVNYLQTS
jgi:hypothetical protein